MLVKCISYIITVFGTKRYKPFLFVGVAVIATLVGVNTIISVYQPAQKPIASSVDTAEADAKTYDSQGLSEQKLKTQDAAAATDQQPAAAATDQTEPSTPSTTTKPTATNAPTIQTSVETVTIKYGNSIATNLSASLSDTSTAQWTYSLEQITGLNVATVADKQASATYTLTFKADTNAAIGTHTLTLTAKDPARGTEISKTIKLVIVAE